MRSYNKGSIIKNNVKICYWNIGGLNTNGINKLHDDAFIHEIQSYDIIILAETHIGYNTIVNIDGFNYFPLCRQVSANGRFYGGLGIFRRSSLKDHIKILPGPYKDFQWVKIEKDYFNLKKDIYLCTAYIPPANSSYSRKLDIDLLDLIEKDIIIYKQKGDVLLLGDLNARTSNLADFICQDSTRHLPLFDFYKTDNQIENRRNLDRVLDDRGKELIDICISNQMRIINGRTTGDIFGQYTCFNVHGQSTVDYLIANEEIIDQILYFRVSDFLSTFSDCHCKISFEILAKYEEKSINNNYQKAPFKYKWKENSAVKFQEALESPEVQQMITGFLNQNQGSSQEDINRKAQDLTDILLSTAKISLYKPKYKKRKSYRKRNKWFDNDLFKMRSNLISLGKLYAKFPNDPYIKGKYYRNNRLYNKSRKAKYKDFMNSMFHKLEKLQSENPKHYWQLVNDIKGLSKNDSSSQIDSETWVHHLKRFILETCIPVLMEHFKIEYLN